MKENLPRLLLIAALTALAAFIVTEPFVSTAKDDGTTGYRLGTDLAGGTTLIYSVIQKEGTEPIGMDELIPALKLRLDPGGLYNFVLRPLGTDRVEIIMPKQADPETVKELITRIGQLQFRIVATRTRHADAIRRAERAWPSKKVGEAGDWVPYGRWLPILPDKSPELARKSRDAWPERQVDTRVRFMPALQVGVDLRTDAERAKYVVEKGVDGTNYVLARWDGNSTGVDNLNNAVRTDETGEGYVFLINDPYNITGDYLISTGITSDQGGPAVSFNLNSPGGKLMQQLTTEYRKEEDGTAYQMASVLDGRVESAPNLNGVISDRGIITGNFTQADVEDLNRILGAGRLPAAISKQPTSVFETNPLLGAESIRKGVLSIVVSLVLVMVFLAVYYRFAGVVAVVALLLNIMFTVALMVLLSATWTLPGIAGLVLTVGMSVDANVLIFERIREELDAGASLGMAIREGYARAWSTIFDSNTTTILTAVILFAIGTDSVKGFAVTLIIGIASSMFCALFVTRTVFDVFYDERWLRKLIMARMLTRSHRDFLGVRNLCYVVSLTVIVLGMIALAMRGANNFDIDFTGGTMARFAVTEPMSVADVKQRAEQAGLDNVSVEKIADTAGPDRFILRTTERAEELAGGDAAATDGDSVARRITEAYRDVLKLPTVTVSRPTPVAQGAAGLTDAQREQVREIADGVQVQVAFEKDKPRTLESVQTLVERAFADAGSAAPKYVFALGEGVADPENRTLPRRHTEFLVVSSDAEAATAAAALVEKSIGEKVEFEELRQFGPSVVGEMRTKAIVAIVLSWLAIIGYVWLRFGAPAYGLASVVALVHDVLVALGVTAMVSMLGANFPALSALRITDMKFDLNIVAAVLTLIGYSINDTIVIFDRIREIRGKSPKLTEEIVNRAIDSTLSRTIITSATTFIVVFLLFLFGGASLTGFAFVLVLGIVTGTYSTIYIASPVLLWLARAKEAVAVGPTAERKATASTQIN